MIEIGRIENVIISLAELPGLVDGLSFEVKPESRISIYPQKHQDIKGIWSINLGREGGGTPAFIEMQAIEARGAWTFIFYDMGLPQTGEAKNCGERYQTKIQDSILKRIRTKLIEIMALQPENKPESQEPSDNQGDNKPWRNIKAHYWDQEAVKLWHEGWTNAEIGKKIRISPRRVTNRLSELRQIHGEETVPYKEQRDQNLRKKQNS